MNGGGQGIAHFGRILPSHRAPLFTSMSATFILYCANLCRLKLVKVSGEKKKPRKKLKWNHEKN
jgi:hypothetical protein